MTDYEPFRKPMISDPETEKSVLYCLLFDEKVQKNINMLSEEDFYNSKHRDIFKFFKKNITEGKVLDPALVPQSIRENGEWFSMIDIWALSAHFESYVKKLKELTGLRKIRETAYWADVKTQEEKSPIEIKNWMIDELEDLKVLGGHSVKGGDIYPNFEEDILNKDEFAGITTGFPTFDRLTRGFCPGTFNIIGGIPSVGKTTLALNTANYMCSKLNKKVLYISLEMDYVMLHTKIISVISGISVSKMLSTKKNLSQLDWQGIMDANAKLNDYRLYYLGEERTTTSDIENEIKLLSNVDIVFVDYLQLINPEGKGKSRYEEISTISRNLKKLATKCNIPIVCMASINRSYTTRLDKKPTISDLRDSGNIEYDADTILFLYRESIFRDAEIEEDANEFEHSAELIIAKNRYGICNKSIGMYWDGDKSLFKEKVKESV